MLFQRRMRFYLLTQARKRFFFARHMDRTLVYILFLVRLPTAPAEQLADFESHRHFAGSLLRFTSDNLPKSAIVFIINKCR